MAQVQGTQPNLPPNYSNLCSQEASLVIEKGKKAIQKYFEDVCLAYLILPNVTQKFESKLNAIAKAFRKDTITPEQEKIFLDELRDKFNPMIGTLMSQPLNNPSRLSAQNNSIITIFSQSQLFKFYDSANWIEKLNEKVKKIYE